MMKYIRLGEFYKQQFCMFYNYQENCNKGHKTRVCTFAITAVSVLIVTSDRNVLEHSLVDLCGQLHRSP